MKAFDLEAAKAGAKAITRDGRRVSQLSVSEDQDFPVLARVASNKVFDVFTAGGYLNEGQQSKADLFMATDEDGNYIYNTSPSEAPQDEQPLDEGTPNLQMSFDDVTSKMSDIYYRKNHDYGSSFDESLDKYGLIAAVVRMSDKLNRLHTLSKQDAQIVSESLADTVLDLANYAAMTYLYLMNHKENSEGSEKS